MPELGSALKLHRHSTLNFSDWPVEALVSGSVT